MAVPGNTGRARGLDAVLVETIAVDVPHEDSAAVLRRPVVAQVAQRAGVGMAAASRRVCPLAAARVGPVAAAPVDMVGAALDQLVTVPVEVLTVHASVVSAGND